LWRWSHLLLGLVLLLELRRLLLLLGNLSRRLRRGPLEWRRGSLLKVMSGKNLLNRRTLLLHHALLLWNRLLPILSHTLPPQLLLLHQCPLLLQPPLGNRLRLLWLETLDVSLLAFQTLAPSLVADSPTGGGTRTAPENAPRRRRRPSTRHSR
jgi:hypothetical protein